MYLFIFCMGLQCSSATYAAIVFSGMLTRADLLITEPKYRHVELSWNPKTRFLLIAGCWIRRNNNNFQLEINTNITDILHNYAFSPLQPKWTVPFSFFRLSCQIPKIPDARQSYKPPKTPGPNHWPLKPIWWWDSCRASLSSANALSEQCLRFNSAVTGC